MATTRLADVIVPQNFTDYVVENTMQRTALVQSGAAVLNPVISEALRAGSDSFTVPFWRDLGNEEANITNDDPDDFAAPKKIGAGSQRVRKSFLHNSWSAMNLASELAGSNAIERIQDRATAYWDRQLQARIIASLVGVLADNVANDGGDMVLNITGETGDAGVFSADAVIDATADLGDAAGSLTGIAMHSTIYRRALKADLIDFIPDSQGGSIARYRGLAVAVDDGLPATGTGDATAYTTILFGPGAIGYGMSPPNVAEGTEVENVPSAGNGGGMHVLHSRMNVAVHPAGFSWIEGTLVEAAPSLADLRLAAHWDRVAAERKAIPLAFLISR
ncbi:hypothetical protein LDO26_05840 [Luteimonas sp. BDR2-5]|uniref:hypothetical protein n=1 Tax=Proluteimonas luteida TaxID=2878685 RepID=UPI001E3B83C9|nr:hypothetical protein [Luteimonas sp. BDR2-5]MCD9027726.1 hypothetical protein [Luteimonas sp. BDR2-5]